MTANNTHATLESLIESLWDASWFEGTISKTVLIRIFSTLEFDKESTDAYWKEFDYDINAERPVKITRFTIENLKIPRFEHQVSLIDENHPKITLNVHHQSIEPGAYTAFATPVLPESNEEGIRNAFSRLLGVTALYKAIVGKAFLWDKIFDRLVEIDSPTNWATDMYSITRMPHRCDVHKFSQHNGRIFSEIHSALINSEEDLRARLVLALEYLDRGMSEEESFINYWIALEIICEGRRQKGILRKLCQHYNFTDIRETKDQLGLAKIFSWRDMFMHRGEKPEMDSDVERYIQWMVIDMIRSELGLRCIEGMKEFAKISDLSQIELADNRSEKAMSITLQMKQ
jgi:hypothetical protein